MQSLPNIVAAPAGSKIRSAPTRFIYSRATRATRARIHGTNEPDSIGKAVSSGCIRMMNADAIDLYERVKVGTRVVVL